MQRESRFQSIVLVSLIILITAVLRVVNAEYHLYNMVPVAALALFSGSVLRNKKEAYFIAMASMLLSDIGLALFTNTQGFYGISQIINYAALILITYLGTGLQNRNAFRIAGYSLSGSMLFFLLSNLGTFLGGYYGYRFEGFVQCFTLAIPFYKSELATTFFMNSFLGDLVFSFIAFGAVYFIEKRQVALA